VTTDAPAGTAAPADASDSGWDDDGLHALQGIRGSNFEVVDTRALRNG